MVDHCCSEEFLKRQGRLGDNDLMILGMGMHRSQSRHVDFAERRFRCLLKIEVDFRCGWCLEDGWRMGIVVHSDQFFHSCCIQYWWRLLERFAWLVLHCSAVGVDYCWGGSNAEIGCSEICCGAVDCSVG